MIQRIRNRVVKELSSWTEVPPVPPIFWNLNWTEFTYRNPRNWTELKFRSWEKSSSSIIIHKLPCGNITPKLKVSFSWNWGHESWFWGQKWTLFMGIFWWQTTTSHIWWWCPFIGTGTGTELELSSCLLWGELELNSSSSYRRNWGTELSSF